MIVDTNNRIHILLAKSANEVVCTLLHLRVGTLNCVQLNTIAVTTSVNRRYRTTTETDAIVVTTYDNNFIALLRLLL